MLRGIGSLMIAGALFMLAFAVVVVWAGQSPAQPFLGYGIVAAVPALLGVWTLS